MTVRPMPAEMPSPVSSPKKKEPMHETHLPHASCKVASSPPWKRPEKRPRCFCLETGLGTSCRTKNGLFFVYFPIVWASPATPLSLNGLAKRL